MMELMKKTYLESAVVMKGDYPYFINPICDGNPEITRELMAEMVDAITERSDLDCDMILALEAMALPVATAVTMLTGIPFRVIRKRGHGLPGQIDVEYTTGYSTSEMYVSPIKEGTRVIIIDDVLSTGGTIKALVNALRDNGIVVVEVIAVLNKHNDVHAFSEEIGVPVITLLDVAVVDGRPVIR